MSAKKNNTPKSKKIFYRITFVILLIIFLGSSFYLIQHLLIDPYINNKTMDEIKNTYYQDFPPSDVTSAENNGPDLLKLTAINGDIKGWIKINNTPIDYPVLYSDYYLYHDYKKNYTRYGSIFLDNICILEDNPQNILLHGHHMNNGSMFAKICNYRNLDFYKQNPTFTFDSIYEKGTFKVIAAFITNTNPEHGEIFHYLQSEFKDKSNFLNYVYKVRMRSNINCPVDIKDDDQLITLSTCSYEMSDFRTVVVARRVRTNEDPNVNVSSANYNPNTLYPDAYHKKIGTKKPTFRTFEEDLRDKKISWYLQ